MSRVNCPNAFSKLTEARCAVSQQMYRNYSDEIESRQHLSPDLASPERHKLNNFATSIGNLNSTCPEWTYNRIASINNIKDQCLANYVQNVMEAKDMVLTSNTCNNFDECINLTNCVEMGGKNMNDWGVACDGLTNIDRLRNAVDARPCEKKLTPPANSDC